MVGRAQPTEPFPGQLEFGVVRAFAAHHVWAEVQRKLRSEHILRGVDPGLAIAVWLNDYVPHIRFADMGDARAIADHPLSQRDPSGTPTASLLDLIGPIVVLGDDRDLVDLNLAAAGSRDAIDQGYTMTVAALHGWGAVIVGRVGVVSGIELGRSVVRLGRKPLGALALGAAAVGGALTVARWLPIVRPRARQLSDGIGEFTFEVLQPVAEQIMTPYNEASVGWQERIGTATRGTWCLTPLRYSHKPHEHHW